MSKRQATTPVAGKEKRAEIGSPEAVAERVESLTQEFEENLAMSRPSNFNSSVPNSRRNSNSQSDALITTSRAESYRRKKELARSLYVTPKPRGAFKDKILIKVTTINGNQFRGTLTSDELRIGIFINILGFNKNDIQ
jgi:hypothetical protein